MRIIDSINAESDFDFRNKGRRACRDLENVFASEAFATRLMHAGFRSYVVGEMVTPPRTSTIFSDFHAPAGEAFAPPKRPRSGQRQ
jgi:hypothetical protein